MRPLSIAPMMDRTDRHHRYFMRRITRHTLLYTEMVTVGALLHGDAERHLAFHPSERPLALQLGGDDPEALTHCARLAAERGFDEVNLNVGCPSDRVQAGRFGACLMDDPDRVAEAVAAMREAVELPVTVKHRIGVDDRDRYEDMLRFVDRVAEAGCDRFTVHARKAWLQGLSPKENRTIPPLRYAEVARLKRERPELVIEINGGILTLDQAVEHLQSVDGPVDAVMIGRAAYDDPYLFADADRRVFGDHRPPPTRLEVAEAMLPYFEEHVAAGGRPHHVVRHMAGLFTGQRGARLWRRTLGQQASRPGAGAEVLHRAIDAMRQQT